MTEEEIIRGNKLIAGFLGWKTFSRYHSLKCRYVTQYDMTLLDEPYKNKNDGCLYEGSELFHSSWDWLMPAVEKIDSVCGIDLNEWDLYINDAICTKQKPIVFKACVDFIEWYNKNYDKIKASAKTTI